MAENNGNNVSVDLLFDERMCEQYLLGELSADDQERFETAYFTDDAFFDRFMSVKTEMLDLYSRGELEPEKQERMRIHFSQTAPRRKQIEESKQFIDAVTNLSIEDKEQVIPSPVTESRPFSWFPKVLSLGWAAAGVLLLAVLCIWWISTQQTSDSTPDIATVQTLPDSEHAEELSKVEPSESPSNPPDQKERQKERPDVKLKSNRIRGKRDDLALSSKPIIRTYPLGNTDIDNQKYVSGKNDWNNVDLEEKKVGTFVIELNSEDAPQSGKFSSAAPAKKLQAILELAPVSTRDISQANTLIIYADTTNVAILVSQRVWLSLPGSLGEYTATISTVSGDVHWQTQKAKPTAAGRLTIDLSPSALKGTDYILTLTSGRSKEAVGEYYFHVVRSEQKTPGNVPPK